MRVFVTGADGFIGSHLVEALRDRGDDVTGLALYNSFDSYGWMDEIDGIRKVRGDVRDAEQMRKLIAGHELVFHLAALISVPDSYERPRSYIDTNVTGTLNVLMACREAGAKLVHTSTSEVYGTAQYTPIDEKHPINPQSPYAASKVAADALVQSFVKSYGIQAVILRPFNTYGPRQSERAVIGSFLAQKYALGSIEMGQPEPRRDLMYVADTVSAFLAVSTLAEIGPYNAGTGESIRIGDLAVKIAGDSVIPMRPERLRPLASEVYELRCNASELTKLTGWKPSVTLDEGLKLTADWWCSRTYRRGLEMVA